MTKETEERFKKFWERVNTPKSWATKQDVYSFLSSELSLQREAMEKRIEGLKRCDEKECYWPHDHNAERIRDSAITDVLDIIKGKE